MVCAVPALADLAHGFTDLAGAGFDFSEQKSYPPPAPNYPVDISFAIVVDPPLGPMLATWWGSHILAVPDTLVEDITTAPEDVGFYHLDAVPVYNRAYVFKTGDGFYVKFAFRSEFSGDAIIEYFVQMDGTNNLRDDMVPVRPSTWGAVKALYGQ